jgi:hypothetical protein
LSFVLDLDILSFALTSMRADKSKPRKEVFVHMTTATDSQNIRLVFDAVKLTIINEALRKADLM